MAKPSAYTKLTKLVEKLEQLQNERYDGEKVDYSEFLNDPESEKQDEIFKELKELGFSTRQSTDDVNRSALRKNQEQIKFIASEFDYLFDEIFVDIQLGAKDIEDPAVGGYTAPWHGVNGLEQRIVLDNKRLNNISHYKENMVKSIRTNWHVPINIKENASVYTITHEMGHAAENCIFEKLLKNNANNSLYYDTRYLATKIRNEVEKICKEKYKSDKINISEYSKQNSKEWFAETFTNLILANEPMPIALALNDYIERFK